MLAGFPQFINQEGKFKLELLIEFVDNDEVQYNEKIKNLNVEQFMNKNQDLNLNDLVIYLKKIGYPV